eukprot:3489755-Pleurochrysis_carterae.AAC.1
MTPSAYDGICVAHSIILHLKCANVRFSVVFVGAPYTTLTFHAPRRAQHRTHRLFNLARTSERSHSHKWMTARAYGGRVVEPRCRRNVGAPAWNLDRGLYKHACAR